MKKILNSAILGVVALALTQTVQATPIAGTIGFTGRATLDTPTAATATQVSTWYNPVVNGTSGSFGLIADGTAVTLSPMWNFNTSSLVNPFWQVGGFTYSLASSSITSQGGVPNVSAYVDVAGTGTVSGNGYATTAMSWNFSVQGPKVTSGPETWTFSASAGTGAVPDAASTAILLGGCFTGLVVFRKRQVA